MTGRTNEAQPAAVSEGAKQAGEIWRRWSWVERTVWTERMLTALEQGVKGGRWFSLMDKVTDPKTLGRGFEQVKANDGAAGVDRQSVEDFERNLSQNLKHLSEQLRDGTFQPQPVRRVWIAKLGSRKSGRWESRRFGIGWCKRRCGWCWNRSLNGTLPSTVTDFGPTGDARTPCDAWMTCSSRVHVDR